MIQVPVLPLPTPLHDWIHGLYCDDFAEFHSKDLPARWWLGGGIPSSGVGTAFSRRAIEAMAISESNQIFRPDCLTEDYEAGYRLRRLGMKQVFMPVCRAGLGGSPVATRELFPRTFRSARRQRTRWTTGIALQSWARNGWGANWTDRYWFWHDRKGLIGNPISLAANAICLYGAVTWVTSTLVSTRWGLADSIPRAVDSLLMGERSLRPVSCHRQGRLFCFHLWVALCRLVPYPLTAGQLLQFDRLVWRPAPLWSVGLDRPASGLAQN